jgi:hypothetical protein
MVQIKRLIPGSEDYSRPFADGLPRRAAGRTRAQCINPITSAADKRADSIGWLLRDRVAENEDRPICWTNRWRGSFATVLPRARRGV